MAALSLAIAAASAQASDLWLRKDAWFANSRQDIETAIQLIRDQDLGAIRQMEQRALLNEFPGDIEVIVVGRPFLSGLVEFRLRGSADTYWTWEKAISNTPEPTDPPEPTPAPTPDVGGVEGAQQEIIDGQTVTVLPQ